VEFFLSTNGTLLVAFIIGIGGATPPVGMGAFAEPVAWPSNVLVKRLIKKNMERILNISQRF
jgi:hypothetical protein